MTGTTPGTSVEISDDALSTATLAAVAELNRDGVPERLAAADPTLWGLEAEAEASIRLGWLGLPESSQALVPQLDRLRDEIHAAGLDHVVLAGMGGSSLAPEVIAGTAGVAASAALTVLDTTDPGQVRRVLEDRLERTVVVVASKSGTTIETDSHRRIYKQAFRDAGIGDIARRFVVVTDPGTPLEAYAKEAGHTVVTADPEVGGRYSALSAFGLVPTALAGIDVTDMLDDATNLSHVLTKPGDNPGLTLGAILGAAWRLGRDKVMLSAGAGLAGFGDWAEQLIAESTGKGGRGLLPVVVESADPVGFDDALLVTVAASGGDVAVHGPLGAQFLLWEYAIAVAGRLIGINPFDQPNVQESKDNTNALLGDPDFLAGGAAADAVVLGGPDEDADALTSALDELYAQVPADGYVAVMAYLDRVGDAEAAQLRSALARRIGRPVTFGWGPRYLHSTGQYHKGGPQVGVFLQITGEVTDDLPVPGRPYTLGLLQRAQAAGDRRALRSRGRPLRHVHLVDRAAGIRTLLEAIG